MSLGIWSQPFESAFFQILRRPVFIPFLSRKFWKIILRITLFPYKKVSFQYLLKFQFEFNPEYGRTVRYHSRSTAANCALVYFQRETYGILIPILRNKSHWNVPNAANAKLELLFPDSPKTKELLLKKICKNHNSSQFLESRNNISNLAFRVTFISRYRNYYYRKSYMWAPVRFTIAIEQYTLTPFYEYCIML